MQGPSLYDILGVSEKADSEKIKTAYRKLALRYHPDRNPESAELMPLINEAYEILIDEEKRKYYDDTGTMPPANLQQDNAEPQTIEELIERINQSLRQNPNNPCLERALQFSQESHVNYAVLENIVKVLKYHNVYKHNDKPLPTFSFANFIGLFEEKHTFFREVLWEFFQNRQLVSWYLKSTCPEEDGTRKFHSVLWHIQYCFAPIKYIEQHYMRSFCDKYQLTRQELLLFHFSGLALEIANYEAPFHPNQIVTDNEIRDTRYEWQCSQVNRANDIYEQTHYKHSWFPPLANYRQFRINRRNAERYKQVKAEYNRGLWRSDDQILTDLNLLEIKQTLIKETLAEYRSEPHIWKNNDHGFAEHYRFVHIGVFSNEKLLGQVYDYIKDLNRRIEELRSEGEKDPDAKLKIEQLNYVIQDLKESLKTSIRDLIEKNKIKILYETQPGEENLYHADYHELKKDPLFNSKRISNAEEKASSLCDTYCSDKLYRRFFEKAKAFSEAKTICKRRNIVKDILRGAAGGALIIFIALALPPLTVPILYSKRGALANTFFRTETEALMKKGLDKIERFAPKAA